MSVYYLTEKDLLRSIKVAYRIEAYSEALDAMTGLAEMYIRQGLTQEGADLLAFVLMQPGTAEDTYDHAEELFLELESWVCPRVIWDAREFAQDLIMADMIEYLSGDSVNK